MNLPEFRVFSKLKKFTKVSGYNMTPPEPVRSDDSRRFLLDVIRCLKMPSIKKFTTRFSFLYEFRKWLKG